MVNAFAVDLTLDTIPFVAQKNRTEVSSEPVLSQTAASQPLVRQLQLPGAIQEHKTRTQLTAELLKDRANVNALASEGSGAQMLARGALTPSNIQLAVRSQQCNDVHCARGQLS